MQFFTEAVGHLMSLPEPVPSRACAHLPGMEPERRAKLSVKFVVPGAAVGKGRARSSVLMRNGKPVVGAGGRPIMTHHTPEKTASFENLVKLAAQQAMGEAPPFADAVALELYVFVTPPASWSQKKQRAAIAGEIRPTTKPDADNVLKAIADACNEIVWQDDKQITDLVMRKAYAARAETLVLVKG